MLIKLIIWGTNLKIRNTNEHKYPLTPSVASCDNIIKLEFLSNKNYLGLRSWNVQKKI